MKRRRFRDIRWCVDKKHGEPCPQPCYGCAHDCSGKTVSTAEARRRYPELPKRHMKEATR